MNPQIRQEFRCFASILLYEVSEMPVIYLDVLIVLNWFIDYLLLSLTARLLHAPIRRVRLAGGAALGGLAACQLLLTAPVIVSLLLHSMAAALIVRVSFEWNSLRGYLRQLITFFCVSALLSGLATVFWRISGSETVLTRNGVIYCDISPLMLTGFAVLSYGVVRLYERLTRKRVPAALEYTVTVDDGCGLCECRALYDTGLHLREPFSGAPVIVIHRTVLQPYLPQTRRESLYATVGGNTPLGNARWRMVPYRTVSGNGLLPAFIPLSVTVKCGGKPPRRLRGVYIALSDEPFAGDYAALLGSDVMDGV